MSESDLDNLEAWLRKSIDLFSKIVVDDDRRIALGEQRQVSRALYYGQRLTAETVLAFIRAKKAGQNEAK